MKKSLIAVAGASVAAAAMPVMGVFAATTSTSFTDVVTVNVGSSCTIIPEDGAVIQSDTTDPQTGDRTVVLDDRNYGPYDLMQGHYISNIGGNHIAEDTDDPADDQTAATGKTAATIECSSNTGNVVPGSDDPSQMASGSWILTALGADGGAMVSATSSIPTGAWAEGTSVWQYKVIGSDDATAYGAIPATNAAVIARSKATGGSVTISPRYRVSASASQAEGTYVGKVTYTLIYAE